MPKTGEKKNRPNTPKKSSATKKTENALTPDELFELKQGFAIYDKDSDNSITAEEMATVMRALGFNPTEAEVIDMVASVDKDMNGTIDFDEFCALMAPQMRSVTTQEAVLEAFKVFDQDENEHISAAELRHVMTNLGEKLSEEEANEMIRLADDDGDGLINYNDFIRMMIPQ